METELLCCRALFHYTVVEHRDMQPACSAEKIYTDVLRGNGEILRRMTRELCSDEEM